MKRAIILHHAGLGDLISGMVVINTLKQLKFQVEIICHEAMFAVLKEESIILTDVDKAIRDKFDLLFDLTSSPVTRKWAKRIKAKTKIGGYKNFWKLLKFPFTYNRIYKKNDFTHITGQYYPALQKLDIEHSKRPSLSTNADEAIKIRTKVNFPLNIVGIHPTASNYKKEMMEKHINTIIKFLKSQEIDILFLGSEVKVDQIYNQYISPNVHRFKGSLHEIKYVINDLKLFIGTDSGLFHLASALNVPTLAFFGQTLYSLTGSYADTSSEISIDYPCRPCKANYQCSHVNCMNLIEESKIIESIKSSLITY